MLYLAILAPFIAYFLPTENKNIKLAVSISPTIFVILFRWGLGTDYFSYEYLYNNHNVSSFKEALHHQASSMEYSFRILIYFFKSLHLPFQAFVAFISLTIYLFLIKWIIDTDEDLALSVMLLNGMFLIVWILGALRQGLVLAMGTYLFFNKKVKLNFWQNLLAVLILGQFHASAYIYLPLLIVKEIEFKKHHLMLIVVFSLLLTILPYYQLLKPFNNIRIVDKFLIYVTGSKGFWDFPGLIRLSFVAFIFIFYKHFSYDKHIKKLADISLIGFSFYYILKASEITASRINIFTFILIIPLIVYLIKYFKANNTIYILSLITLFLFSFAYLEKDLIATQKEAEKSDINYVYKLKTFNNTNYKDYYTYDNQFAILTYNKKLCPFTKKYTPYHKREKSKPGNIVILKNKRYGVMSNDGIWIIKPTFINKPNIYGDILDFSKYSSKNIYLNLNRQMVEEPKTLIQAENLIEDKINNEKFSETDVDVSNFKDGLKPYFNNIDKITNPKIINYKFPFEYSVLKVDLINNSFYFYLNDDLSIKDNMIFTSPIRFMANNMAYPKTFCGNVVLNSNGDIIYK